MTNTAYTQEVIITIFMGGKGTEDDPYRLIKQVWSKEGELIAESDPNYSGKEVVIAV